MKLRILKIIHGFPPNYNAGSEVYSQSLCNQLAKHHQITVFSREENIYESDFSIRKHFENNNLSFYFVNIPRGKDGYRHQILDDNFTKVLQETKPNIAHIGHLNHLSTGIIDVLKKSKIPIVYTLHDFWLMCPRGQFLQVNFGNTTFHKLCEGQENRKCAENCYSRYFSGQSNDYMRDIEYWTSWIYTRMKVTKSIVEKVNFFIAPSKYLMNRFINDFKVPKSKIIYLDYGFPLHYLRPVWQKHREIFTFGYIGTHIPAKGLDLLISAFKKIKHKAVLKIWGRENQYTEFLKKMAENSNNKIEFVGEYINHNLATDVFSNIDCIIVPSIWAENSPLVIHEAQACKIPVITANFGGMKEYVEHNVNGLLFEHRSESSLTEQLNFAVFKPDKMKKLGQRGYLYSFDGSVPSIENHCNELEDIYNKIISKNKL